MTPVLATEQVFNLGVKSVVCGSTRTAIWTHQNLNKIMLWRLIYVRKQLLKM